MLIQRKMLQSGICPVLCLKKGRGNFVSGGRVKILFEGSQIFLGGLGKVGGAYKLCID